MFHGLSVSATHFEAEPWALHASHVCRVDLAIGSDLALAKLGWRTYASRYL